ncbi:MAG: ACT domain-containing protein [Clostridia bacterium]|nr:ACT domain-containing protein [Clostridia bacterium]
MKLEVLAGDFTVCKVADYSGVDLADKYCFIGKTCEENSLVCETSRVPANTAEREDGWRALRVAGTLDFSLIGILAQLSAVLARKQIGIFVVSTYNTDYIFLKKDRLDEAVKALETAGYPVI